MSDTWRQNAIVQAMQIIANKKIAQAGYDKTRRGVISQVIDKTSGKYKIKYQDSQFQAYATSSDVYYEIGQLVSFLVPGNDWSREITILSGVKNYATNYAEVPQASQLYNKTGPSAVKSEGVFGLCSYKDEEKNLNNLLHIDQQIGRTYIPRGNGLVIGMDVQTSLDSAQVNGNYGLKFDLIFRNIQTGSQNSETDFSQGGAAVRSYFVTDRDVIGNPYGLTKTTTVEHLLNIDDVNPADFIGIKDIVAYCNGFPFKSKDKDNDIFFSNIHINGVEVLSDQDLNGYVVHIDYSETGQILDKSLDLIKLQASLKVNGKKVTSEDQLSYYWFRQNGLIFRNSSRYSSYGGDGWECLNNFNNNKPIPATNTIYFTNLESKIIDTPLTVGTLEKNTRIKCVAVYKYKETSGFQNVIDNTKKSFYIDSNQKQTSDNINKVDYYLDYGMPSLTCLPQGYKQGDDLSNYTFSWSVVPARGQAIQIQETDDTDYNRIKNQYQTAQEQIEKVPQADLDNYKTATGYQAKVNEYNRIKNISYANKNIYYNFPISSIINYSRIICSVHEGDTYVGSASITLYNHTQVPDTYSLNIENSTQVFQYDGKGNSPTSPQLEKPLQIKPLTFTLIDDEGNQVSYQQIINNGYVEWIVPIQNTLLISDDEKNGGPLDNTLLIGTDKALAASLGYEVNIYKASVQHALTEYNLASFVYKIEDTYDSKKVNNNIRLDVKYKDMLFTAYTDFTFPKDGDPGTNGTDYVVKLTPSTRTDRVYISNKNPNVLFDDNGSKVDKLNFQLYNNSRKIEGVEPSLWTCPPKGTSDDKNKGNTYINSFTNGVIEAKILTQDTILVDKPIDIIRVLYKNDNLNQYAEYPICYNYFEDLQSNSNYRFKIKPKTGFKYAVYQQDGTSPQYDNTLPFEVIIQVYQGTGQNKYFIAQNQNNFIYDWYSIGQIEEDEDRNTKEEKTLKINQKYFKPKNNFDGLDLTSAIVVKIYQKDENEVDEKGAYIGYLHVPIYMIINRYGHSALNNWDGNSIQLNANGDTILAPQIGAGRKETDNSYTGVFMGDVKDNSDNEDIGLMGYQHGQRSIFLDAETGNATFGKNGAGQIKIDARTNQGTISSGDYTPSTSGHNGKGLKIKFSSTPENVSDDNPEKGPYIRFGSNRFSVNAKGQIHAAGSGDIAGWNINDEAIYKHDGTNKTGMRSTGDPAFYAGTSSQNSITPSSTAAYNFFVNHNGFLYSKSGQIAKWSINEDTLTDGNVGMGTNPNTINFTYNVGGVQQTAAITDSRIWSGNKFVITNSGKLYAKDGQIGPWTIGDTSLTNGYVGLGYNVIDKSRFSTSNNITARIWSGAEGSQDFAVTNNGALYSRSGKIGGWTITDTKLSASGIDINSTGDIQSNYSKNNKTGYSIKGDGNAVFYNIDANRGTIGSCTINDDSISAKKKDNTGKENTWYIKSDGTASFNNITASGGQIGGMTITETQVKGDGWFISDNYAHFNGLKVDSNGVSSGGSGISGGSKGGAYTLGGNSAAMGNCDVGNGFTIGNEDNKTYIKDLVVERLTANSFTYGKEQVFWRSVTVATSINSATVNVGRGDLDISTTSTTINGTSVLTGASLTGSPGDSAVTVKLKYYTFKYLGTTPTVSLDTLKF